MESPEEKEVLSLLGFEARGAGGSALLPLVYLSPSQLLSVLFIPSWEGGASYRIYGKNMAIEEVQLEEEGRSILNVCIAYAACVAPSDVQSGFHAKANADPRVLSSAPPFSAPNGQALGHRL